MTRTIKQKSAKTPTKAAPPRKSPRVQQSQVHQIAEPAVQSSSREAIPASVAPAPVSTAPVASAPGIPTSPAQPHLGPSAPGGGNPGFPMAGTSQFWQPPFQLYSGQAATPPMPPMPYWPWQYGSWPVMPPQAQPSHTSGASVNSSSPNQAMQEREPVPNTDWLPGETSSGNAEVQDVSGDSGVAALVGPSSVPKSTLGLAEADLLDEGISAKLKAAIVSNEFIDLKKLDKNFKEDRSFNLSIANDEDLSLKLSKPPVKPQDQLITLSAWLDYFTRYMYVYLEKYPDQARPMITYMHTVRTLAKEQKDWRGYDRAFRERRVRRETPWNLIDSHAYTRAFQSATPTVGESRQKSQYTQQQSRSKGKNMVPKRYCIKFHTANTCPYNSDCRYFHTCFKCGKEHSASKCLNNTSARDLHPSPTYLPPNTNKQSGPSGNKNANKSANPPNRPGSVTPAGSSGRN